MTSCTLTRVKLQGKTQPWGAALVGVHKALGSCPSTSVRVSAHSFGYIKHRGKDFHRGLPQLGHLPGDWAAFRLQSFPGNRVSSAHGPQAGPLRAHPSSLFKQIRSRAKIEKIRASLFNNNDLIGLSSLDGEDELMEMSTEEILTVSVVNQSLFDTQGSPGLEDYFSDKSIKGEL